MTHVYDFEQQWKDNYPGFCRIFDMPYKNIGELISLFVSDKEALDIVNNTYSCTKIYRDDKPDEIGLHFYSSIKITPFGVNVYPEHSNASTICSISDLIFKIDKIGGM